MSGPACKHERFEARCDVIRIEDSVVWVAELRLRCANCGEVGRFLGMEAGAGGGVPRSSLCADEARLPVIIDLPAEVWLDHEDLSDAAREEVDWVMNKVVDPGPGFTVRGSENANERPQQLPSKKEN